MGIADCDIAASEMVVASTERETVLATSLTAGIWLFFTDDVVGCGGGGGGGGGAAEGTEGSLSMFDGAGGGRTRVMNLPTFWPG